MSFPSRALWTVVTSLTTAGLAAPTLGIAPPAASPAPAATPAGRVASAPAPTVQPQHVDVPTAADEALDPAISHLEAATLVRLAAGDELALPTADGGSVRLRVASVGTTPSGARALTFVGDAALGSSPLANATIVVRGDRVAGFIRARDGLEVTLAPTGPGVQAVRAKDERDGDCGGVIGPPAGKQLEPLAQDCPDSPLTVDVLVVYTAEASAYWGGALALEALIESAIVDANIALKNTGLEQRLRLVGTELIPFAQGADIGADLDAIEDPSDGNGDIVHAYRTAYGADLVQLVSTSGGACGIASLFTGSPSLGFSVVDANCLGGYTPAHEIGHNFGCCHAIGDGGGCGVGGYYLFSNGWRFTGDSGTLWHTVMAYDPGTRIPYFSTPYRYFDGQQVGKAGFDGNAADNARTIGLTAASVAQFRCHVDAAVDCNNNGTPDAIDVMDGTSSDCNGNGVPDECDISKGFSLDENTNGIPDECEIGDAKFTPVEPAGDPRILDAFGFSAAVGRLLNSAVDASPIFVVGAFGDDQSAQNSGAAYVYGLAGSFSQQAKLKASDPLANANFGRSVASFRRAAQATPPATARNYAVAGAYRANDGTVAEKGAAYVYADDGAGWVQKLKQKASDGAANDWFGFSVAMTRIGLDVHDTLVIGAPHASGGKGAVYVYRYTATDTTTLSKKIIVPLTGAGDDFGWSVAVDNDVTIDVGGTPTQRAILVAGVPGDGENVGRVRVYERTLANNQSFPSNGQNIALDPGDAATGDRFGEAVAISDNLVVVGAPGKFGGKGAAYVFNRTSPTVWTQREELLPDSSQSDGRFGQSVSLFTRSDGAVFLEVGAPKSEVATPSGQQNNAGLVYRYQLNATGTTVTFLGTRSTPDAQSGDEHGTAIGLFQLSTTAPLQIWSLVGSPFDDDSGLNSGSAYFFPSAD